MAGTSILGDGGGAGGGGLNRDQPGGIICWPKAAPETNVQTATAIESDRRFIASMS